MSPFDTLLTAARQRYSDAAALVEASLRRYRPFDLSTCAMPIRLKSANHGTLFATAIREPSKWRSACFARSNAAGWR